MARGSFLGLAFAAMLSIMTAPAMAQAPAPPPITGPVYLIGFFEVAPAAVDKTAPLLTQYAAESRKADGNSGVLALRETGRPGRFGLVELWRDKPAAEAHGAALGALGEKLKTDITAPFDTRFNAGLDVAGPTIGAEPGAGTVYVLTHV